MTFFLRSFFSFLVDLLHLVDARLFFLFFLVSRFSFTDTVDSQNSKGREETTLIPLYLLHLLMNILAFICSLTWLHCLFNRRPWKLPNCYLMRFIHLLELSFTWILIAFYLLAFRLYLITLISHRQTVSLNSHWQSPWFHKQNG